MRHSNIKFFYLVIHKKRIKQNMKRIVSRSTLNDDTILYFSFYIYNFI